MKLRKLSSNATEVVTDNGVVVLFSYSTPVAETVPQTYLDTL